MEKIILKGKINVIFDNIAFSLQTSGGVTGVWKELIEKILMNDKFDCRFLEYKLSNLNINRKLLMISDDILIKKNIFSLFIERFRDPKIELNTPHIFHSSYYRVSTNKFSKNVTTVHDFIYERFRSGLPLFVNYLQKRRSLLKSDAIICVSENTRKDLLHYFPFLEKRKIFVVHNGVDSTVFKKLKVEKPDFIEKLGKYVLYIGNREQKHKNFFPLVESLKDHVDINLVLVGGGLPKLKEIKKINKYLNGRVVYLNNIDNSKLNLLYNFAFSLIYPSIYEGFGMPIIEAQSAGCPVIATRGSSISEIAYESAILVNNGTSMEISEAIDLLNNTNTRNDFISLGLTNSKRFSWSKMAGEIANIYESLL